MVSSYKWNNHPTTSVCVVPIIRLRLGRGLIYGGSPCSAHPLLTFGFSKWSTCTCGFIKYKLNQSRKKLQIILETAVALFWYQCHASILLICSIVAFNLNLWCVIFIRELRSKRTYKKHYTINVTKTSYNIVLPSQYLQLHWLWLRRAVPSVERLLSRTIQKFVVILVDFDWDEQARLKIAIKDCCCTLLISGPFQQYLLLYWLTLTSFV